MITACHPLARDLQRHFDRRLKLLIVDTLDTCRRAEMTRDARVALAVDGLARALVLVTSLAEGDEAKLLELIHAYFRSAAEREATASEPAWRP